MFHILIWGGLGSLFGGAKPTKAPPPWRRDCSYPRISTLVSVPNDILLLNSSSLKPDVATSISKKIQNRISNWTTVLHFCIKSTNAWLRALLLSDCCIYLISLLATITSEYAVSAWFGSACKWQRVDPTWPLAWAWLVCDLQLKWMCTSVQSSVERTWPIACVSLTLSRARTFSKTTFCTCFFEKLRRAACVGTVHAFN